MPAKPAVLAEIATATKAYCDQARCLQLTATDFYDWLDALPPARRALVKERGLRACRFEPNFLRFCLEWRGYDMWSFMAANLSLEAFEYWASHGQFAGQVPARRVH
jgi:hypothetical protein